MRFELRVLRPGSNVITLPLDAANTDDAADKARQQGYSVLRAKGTPTLSLVTFSDARSFPPLSPFSQDELDVVQKKIVGAAIYPFLLGNLGSLVIFFLLGYVIPRFSRIVEDMGGEVPFMSRLLINWGNLVHDHGGILLISSASLLSVTTFWLMRPRTRTRCWIFERMTAIPAIGERWRTYQLARFYRTVGMLLRGGMPIMASLSMASDLLQGSLRDRLSESARYIREGMQISTAMEAYGLTTPVSLSLLRVGERTGRMGEMMERIASFHDGEVVRGVDWFVHLFEPLLMAFIGFVIGAIVVITCLFSCCSPP